MLSLVTFGGLRLERDGVPLSGAVARRRQLAVLAVIAAAGPAGVSRDRITGLLWPESDAAKARNVLKQTLHVMRRETGCADIVTGAAELRLNSGAVACDLWRFEDALRNSDHEGAMRLYAGPFLDGFFVDGAGEFERWTEEVRRELARKAAKSSELLARSSAGRGDFDESVNWWYRRAGMAPLDSSAAVQLVHALAAAGDRAGALRYAALHERMLREELDVSPSSAFRLAVERLRGEETSDSTPLISTLRPPAAPEPLSEGGPPDATVTVDGELAPAVPVYGSPRVEGSRSWLRRRRAWLLGVSGIVGLAVVPFVLAARYVTDAPAAARLHSLAVLPFDVSGVEPDVRYLAVGMANLLADQLRDPPRRAVVSMKDVLIAAQTNTNGNGALSDFDIKAIARATQADRVITGHIVGTSRKLVVHVMLTDAGLGRVIAEASATGPELSLDSLSTWLAGQLLVRQAGEPEPRAHVLLTTSLPALRNYLEGQVAYRAGQYEIAAAQYDSALMRDSTFAYAALGLVSATVGDASGSIDGRSRGQRLAWLNRNRLAPSDREYLASLSGPHYPGPSSMAEFLGAWRRAVDMAPNRPETWFGLGDSFFHDGRILGIPRSWEAARAAIDKSLELDSTFAPALDHRIQLAAHAGDTVGLRRLAERYFAIDSIGPLATFLRWRVALAFGDDASRTAISSDFDSAPATALRWIIEIAPFEGQGMRDAIAALDARARHSKTIAEKIETALAEHSLALNRGRPAEANRLSPTLASLEPEDYFNLRFPILASLYERGDSATAANAASQLSDAIERSLGNMGSNADDASAARCVLAQWWIRTGATGRAREAVKNLRSASASAASAVDNDFCATLLEASITPNGAARRAFLDRLDSLIAVGVHMRRMWPYAQIAVARLFAASGAADHALATSRRMGYFGRWPYYLASALLEQGDYALAAGDTAGAICAFNHYLHLRIDPEPTVVPEVLAVRARLGALRTTRRQTRCDD